MARDLQPILGYTTWENFANVIEKAKMACDSAGIDSAGQFRDTTKGIAAGKGAEVQRVDVFLSRYACYLVAMNGDSRKPEIGHAQTYFAVQTRRQEIRDQDDAQSRRIELRQRVKEANRALTSAAKNSGVQNYGLFHDAGYRGLYGLSLQEIKVRKGIGKDDLLDRAGRVELAANEFRITQAEDKLRRDEVRGESRAIQTHRDVGQAVRATIQKLGGALPEDLKPEPSIKKLASARQRQLPKRAVT